MHTGTEPHRAQHLGDPFVVVPVPRRIEADEFRVPLFVDIEERFHVKTFHCLRRRLRHRRRIRFDAHELDALFTRAESVSATTTTTRWPQSSSTDYVRAGEISRSDDRTDNEKKDQCVQQQRRNDPFPLFFLFLARLEGWVARDYFTSFGGTPITLTPAPRDTSIAQITSEYFTAGSPLTKIIFSGRGS